MLPSIWVFSSPLLHLRSLSNFRSRCHFQKCSIKPLLPRTVRQCRRRRRYQQRPFPQPRDECGAEAPLPTSGRMLHAFAGSLRPIPLQHCRCPVKGRCQRFQSRFPWSVRPGLLSASSPPCQQTDPVVVMMLPQVQTTHAHPTSHTPLHTISSPLRPPCKASERIFLWWGVNSPPPSTIDNPVIQLIASRASCASLRDTASYGAGLRKFHLFCDIFSIPESNRLPASFELLHSFALWAVTDPDCGDSILLVSGQTPFEPISVSVA